MEHPRTSTGMEHPRTSTGMEHPRTKPLSRLAITSLALALAAAGCSDTTSSPDPSSSANAPASDLSSNRSALADSPKPVDPSQAFDPVKAGEPLPEGFRQLLGRDDIAPVYDPVMVAAESVDWDDSSLVIGVNLEQEARAYPVGFLNRREIVNDMHRGIPTLVTW